MADTEKQLDLDMFGEIMDQVIHKTECAMMVHKEADSDEWEVSGSKSAVINFYYMLNALPTIYRNMIKQLGRGLDEFDAKELAGALCDEMRKTLEETAEEMRKEE